jgi:hypothetical protein
VILGWPGSFGEFDPVSSWNRAESALTILLQLWVESVFDIWEIACIFAC